MKYYSIWKETYTIQFAKLYRRFNLKQFSMLQKTGNFVKEFSDAIILLNTEAKSMSIIGYVIINNNNS